MKHIRLTSLAVAAIISAATASAQHYTRTDLNTDAKDADLVNPWGLARSSGSPWWVADNGTSKSTLYDATGAKQGLIVVVPGGPTGTVFNGTGDFKLSNGKNSSFLFASEGAGISAWTGGATEAVFVAGGPSAIYKGLAIASIYGQNYLYATDFHGGKIDVWDASFAPVRLGRDAFRLDCDSDRDHDRDKDRGHCKFVPFNIQNIGGNLFVTFAKQGPGKEDEVDGPGLGAVAAFSPEGRLLKVFEHGPWLNAPWGIALAPGDFGVFSHSLLVGQFGSGQIAAYDILTGKFLGLFQDSTGNPIGIDGLWAISFGNDTKAGLATTLYFAAGPNGESGGIFGTLTPLAADLALGNGN